MPKLGRRSPAQQRTRPLHGWGQPARCLRAGRHRLTAFLPTLTELWSPDRRHQDEPEALDIVPQLDGAADDGTIGRVRAEVRIILASAEPVAAPGNEVRPDRCHEAERICFPLPPPAAWHPMSGWCTPERCDGRRWSTTGGRSHHAAYGPRGLHRVRGPSTATGPSSAWLRRPSASTSPTSSTRTWR